MDERQTQPWNAGTTYLGGGQSGQDDFRRGGQRDRDSPRQTSYSRDESYEERTHYQGGYRPSYGRAEPDEQRNTYEEQSYGRGSYGEDHAYGQREDERRISINQPYRAHQQYEGERRQGYGDYSTSQRHQEYDVRTSCGDEYGASDSYGERQRGHGGGEYGRSGGGYDGSSRRDRYGDAEGESYGRRSGGYGREEIESEETFGAERLNLNEGEVVDGGYSWRQGYGGREQQEGGYQVADY